jgi:RNA polymerase sigma factor (TIGR02999 family)
LADNGAVNERTEYAADAAPDDEAVLRGLLQQAQNGDREAYDRVFARAYEELRGLARVARRRLSGATIDTTGLVHECYLRLLRSRKGAGSAEHFLAIAARAMRHLLIEFARARLTQKRGGDMTPVSADADEVAEQRDARELIEIDDLLRRLAAVEPQQAAVVECRFFGGLSDAETARALGVSTRTVHREWTRARAWLAGQ